MTLSEFIDFIFAFIGVRIIYPVITHLAEANQTMYLQVPNIIFKHVWPRVNS